MKVAIIGAGVIGLSLARELLQSGEKVTVYDPAPGSGASQGNSRIFRCSHDDPRMVKLGKENNRLWGDLEKSFGQELINRCGLFYSGTGARSRYRLLQENNIPSSWKEAGEIMPDDAVLWENEGGSIYCWRVFSSLFEEAKSCLVNEKVLEVSGGKVISDSSKRKFDRVFSLAGQGTEDLFSEWCREIDLCHVPHLRIDFKQKRAMPAWIDHHSKKYGLPGFSIYSIGSQRENVVLARQEIMKLAKRLQGSLDPEPLGYTLCPSLQIAGSSEGWRVGTVDRGIIFAGGNSYKWAPLHGKSLASLLREEDPGKDWRSLAGLTLSNN